MKRARPHDRDAALDAALTLFWMKGYHATSLKDLEAALKMKPGSIYAAFSSKEALYLSALERYFHRSRDSFRSMIAAADSPLEALGNYLRSYGQKQNKKPETSACMLVKTMLSTTTEEAALAERSRQYLAEMRAEIVTAFDFAKAKGELPADADTARLAHRYQADITALRIEAHRGTAQKDLAALAEGMALDIERLRADTVMQTA